MTTEPDTSVIARILATGFNRHIELHGPDGDYASEAMGFAGGHGVVVHCGVSEFSVRVERLPGMTANGPKTPGQCWTALREEIEQERAAQDEQATGHAELGHRDQEERAYGRVEALDGLLATMDRTEAG